MLRYIKAAHPQHGVEGKFANDPSVGTTQHLVEMYSRAFTLLLVVSAFLALAASAPLEGRSPRPLKQAVVKRGVDTPTKRDDGHYRYVE